MPFNDNSSVDKDILFIQFISAPIKAQTIASQIVDSVVMGLETHYTNNLYLTLVIKIMSGDGLTLRGTILALTHDGTELDWDILTSRYFSATSTEVIAQEGDRVVVEIGVGGNPSYDHDSSLRFGDPTGSTDILEVDNDENTAHCPWVAFTNAITMQ